ncbi:PREDICTED: uncharacterized protein LOC104816196 isoform X2 [Tarenaya hassleriana]|uniref:uncharacterized protein LOC104816196 isoform X2 n=1 Tax=Tarenaya hassleriana TaxID=28532 RepID=UPI00053C0987|nr:PREDICTED: uncharacterized protein LOC104816196 isoform X2 [Tarenaya hassleriana]
MPIMVGIMTSNSGERLDGLANSAKLATELPPKLDRLRQLRRYLQEDSTIFSSELLPLLFDLLSDRFGAVRKIVAEILGEIGLKHLDYLPEIVPVFIEALKDETPAVARQVIACGANLFRSTLESVAVQGLHSSELNELLESSWAWMLKFKDEICSLAFEGRGGVRLLAMKFVETLIVLYTPDTSGSLEPPSHEGNRAEFNISFLRGGHPVLNVGDLSIEASQKLGLLLDQLRHPAVKSLNSSAIIVLINSLSSVAKKRPAYCGRILPVLLSFDPPAFVKGVNAAAAHRALKTVFLYCLKCTHPTAAPWKDRLICALGEIESGDLAGKAQDQFFKSNGSTEDKDNVHAIKSNFRRKRSGSHDNNDLDGDATNGKRARLTPPVPEESRKGLNGNVVSSQLQVGTPSTGPSNSRGGCDSGPVQQLVAMFGALVAQGEKAIGSLEILISSISADLLVDVVMANMHNLPSKGYEDEGADELVMNMSIVGSDAEIKYPPSFLAGVLSLSTTFPPIASQIFPHIPKIEDGVEELCADHVDDHPFLPGDAVLAADVLASSDAALPTKEVGDMMLPSDVRDVGDIESGIPGLDSSVPEAMVSASASTDVEDANQIQSVSFSGKPIADVMPSLSMDRSEELSPKVDGTSSNGLVSSTATSDAVAPHFVLPKISAPVVDLSDEDTDSLQKLMFIRIVEAYKQIAVSGGSQLRFSLLAHLGVEFPLELDPWKLLQEHILSDYLNHEGHELTVRVLYRLYGEAEEEQDFFSSTTAASVYETFLLTVAEALRDSFPPSDKALSKLLGDAPYLPDSVLKLLEAFCCPGSSEKVDKDVNSGDRVTQGLSAVWSLILLRPGIRDACLKIALQSAVHHLEEVRMKAIRLVANKLYPLSYIAHQIEEFAKDMLFSVVSGTCTERPDAEAPSNESRKDLEVENIPNEPQSVNGINKDMSEASQSYSSSASIPAAQQCMSLYFALCTKKHSLFRHVFSVYKNAPDHVKQAIHRHIPILVRTMGSSPELLEIIADPPSGSENLLMQVLQTLTDGHVPSSELIQTIRKLFETKMKDAEILFPILPFMPRDDVLRIFPHLVNLPLEKFQVALSRVLQGSPRSGPVLSPSEVLIAIHGIDPERDGIPLKKVIDACNACFGQRQIFTQQVLAGVLNQLVQQIPLPLLFMRTVLQAIGAFPALVDFILDILLRLVSKQIWKSPKLWVGFLKCAQLTQPQSYKVLLQLPSPQLDNALTKISVLKAPLAAHASQPDIRSSLPRSTLAVLGIAQDSSAAQTSQVQPSEGPMSQGQQASEAQMGQSQQVVSAQVSQSQASQAETSQSEVDQSQSQTSPEGTTERQPEMSQTQESDPQATSQVQLSQAQTSQTQTSDSQASSHAVAATQAHQTTDTADSEHEPVTVTEESKESPCASG